MDIRKVSIVLFFCLISNIVIFNVDAITMNEQVHEQVADDEDNVGPSMCLYTKKFYDYLWPDDQIPPLDVEIFVQDASGVDTVIVSYSKESDSWTNITMVQQEGEENWYEAQIDFFNTSTSNTSDITSTYIYEYGYDALFQVRYFANDTLGNIAMTENLPYKYRISWTASDGSTIILQEQRDRWFVVGTEGHKILWNIVEGRAASYEVKINGHLIESWHWTGPVEIDLDGLPEGTYTVRLSASYGVAWDVETFKVHIVENSSLLEVINSISSEPYQYSIYPVVTVVVGAIMVTVVMGLWIIRKYADL